MAKKTSIAKRFKHRRRLRLNPDGGSVAPAKVESMVVDVAGGLAGYAVGKFSARAAYAIAKKKWPGAAPHVSAAASGASFLAVWLLGGILKQTRDFHLSATVGSGIAALQILVRTYIPRLGWLLADVNPKDYAPARPLSERQNVSPLEPVDEADLLPDESPPPPRGEEARADDQAPTATANYITDDDDDGDLRGGIFGDSN